MGIYREIVTSSLAESTIFLVADSVVSFLSLLLFGFTFLSSLGLLLLVESAVFMLVGGALDFSRTHSGKKILSLMGVKTKDDSKASERTGRRAGIFTLTGVILFLESLLLAIVFY